MLVFVLFVLADAVWGDKDSIHEYALADFYWQKAPHVHLKTIAGWGHARLCSSLHKLDLHKFESMWVYKHSDDACSDTVIQPATSTSSGSSKAAGRIVPRDAGGKKGK